jgi:hypothetical protein
MKSFLPYLFFYTDSITEEGQILGTGGEAVKRGLVKKMAIFMSIQEAGI